MFYDRAEAGRLLAERLKKYQKDGVAAAIPRGGVVLGAEIARLLEIPLELVLVRKIGKKRKKE